MTKQYRIMLVEDESIIAMEVKQRLERLGYQVVAQAALRTRRNPSRRRRTPDLILMDVKIREAFDGIETARSSSSSKRSRERFMNFRRAPEMHSGL